MFKRWQRHLSAGLSGGSMKSSRPMPSYTGVTANVRGSWVAIGIAETTEYIHESV
jgi:hypothetical protein